MSADLKDDLNDSWKSIEFLQGHSDMHTIKSNDIKQNDVELNIE